MTLLTKNDILRALRKIDLKARAAQVIVDLAIYGGTAMALVFDTRQATRDVDAIVRGAVDFLRSVVAEIAEEEGWPSDWLNDGVKGFVSANEKMQLMQDFQASPGGGLRVYTPTPEYLFAMKCMAMRPEEKDHTTSRTSKRSPKSPASPMSQPRCRSWKRSILPHAYRPRSDLESKKSSNA